MRKCRHEFTFSSNCLHLSTESSAPSTTFLDPASLPELLEISASSHTSMVISVRTFMAKAANVRCMQLLCFWLNQASNGLHRQHAHMPDARSQPVNVCAQASGAHAVGSANTGTRNRAQQRCRYPMLIYAVVQNIFANAQQQNYPLSYAVARLLYCCLAAFAACVGRLTDYQSRDH